jgi:hexosaminidase
MVHYQAPDLSSQALDLFLKRFGKGDSEEISFKKGNGDAFIRTQKGVEITYSKSVRAFELLAYALANRNRDSYAFERKVDQLTFMLDCSRNAVLLPEKVEELIVDLAYLGYDRLELYTEDTYQVDGEPYFGYFRGAYTREEFQRLDRFAQSFGIELVPCVQTLAHLSCLERFPRYQGYFDIDDILLCDDPKVDALLEKMVSSLRESFTSHAINIGMDEAYFLGRGRHFDLHGEERPSTIMIRHLKKVYALLKKYDFTPEMWSDMFLGDASKDKVNGEALKSLPKDIELVHWDYYHVEKKDYESKFIAHKALGHPLAFATGAWKWTGFAPNNAFSFQTMEAGMTSALENGIRHITVTAWGDNGGECSPFAVLPSLFVAREILEGRIKDTAYDQPSFFLLTGMPLARFLDLDSTNQIVNGSSAPNDYARRFLYNDPLMGLVDSLVPSDADKVYTLNGDHLKEDLSFAGDYHYLFETQIALNQLLAKKALLGLHLREAYQKKDNAALTRGLEEIQDCRTALSRFDRLFRKQWFFENKPQGWDVQDLRLGGLEARLESAEKEVGDYLKGITSSIPELAEKALSYFPDQVGTPERFLDMHYGKFATGGQNF